MLKSITRQKQNVQDTQIYYKKSKQGYYFTKKLNN